MKLEKLFFFLLLTIISQAAPPTRVPFSNEEFWSQFPDAQWDFVGYGRCVAEGAMETLEQYGEPVGVDLGFNNFYVSKRVDDGFSACQQLCRDYYPDCVGFHRINEDNPSIYYRTCRLHGNLGGLPEWHADVEDYGVYTLVSPNYGAPPMMDKNSVYMDYFQERNEYTRKTVQCHRALDLCEQGWTCENGGICQNGACQCAERTSGLHCENLFGYIVKTFGHCENRIMSHMECEMAAKSLGLKAQMVEHIVDGLWDENMLPEACSYFNHPQQQNLGQTLYWFEPQEANITLTVECDEFTPCLCYHDPYPTASPTQLPTSVPTSSAPSLSPSHSQPTSIPTSSQPSQSPVSSPPTTSPSPLPSADCAAILDTAACRQSGCAWISHLQACRESCVEIPDTMTIGTPLSSIFTDVTACEGHCLDNPSCVRFSHQSPSMCYLFSTYTGEVPEIGTTTGACLHTFEPTGFPTAVPSSAAPSLAPTDMPTRNPTATDTPTQNPTNSLVTSQPTISLSSSSPSTAPVTSQPTTSLPSSAPSASPSLHPSISPSHYPTTSPAEASASGFAILTTSDNIPFTLVGGFLVVAALAVCIHLTRKSWVIKKGQKALEESWDYVVPVETKTGQTTNGDVNC